MVVYSRLNNTIISYCIINSYVSSAYGNSRTKQKRLELSDFHFCDQYIQYIQEQLISYMLLNKAEIYHPA
jgi:hypothetical protein